MQLTKPNLTAGNAPKGKRLIEQLGPHHGRMALLMDNTYQDDAAQALACNLGMTPIVPPNPQRRLLWRYDQLRYRQMEGIAWRWQSMNGATFKAPLAQEAVGRHPTDRKKRSKRHLLAHGRGVLLPLVVSASQ